MKGEREEGRLRKGMEGRVIRGMRDRTKGGEMKKNTGKITAEICETRQGEKMLKKFILHFI